MSAGGASIVPQSDLASDAIPDFLTRILTDAPALRQMSDAARLVEAQRHPRRSGNCRGGGLWLRPSSLVNP